MTALIDHANASAALVDAAGRPIGTIRGGRQVRVRADRVGSDGAHAEISIAQPVRVRGFVPREALRVFLRRDLSIERDRTWWTAGTPLQIFGGDARRAEVRRDEANRLTVPQPLRCGLLVGTVGSHDVLEDPCHCRVVSPRAETSGAPVWWRDPPPVTVERGRGYPRVQIENQLGGWLLERKGRRVLVEFVDVWNHLRVRRWVSADGGTGPDDTFTDVDPGASPGEVVVRQRRRPCVFGAVPKAATVNAWPAG